MLPLKCLIACALLILCCGAGATPYHIEVSKAERLLLLKQGDRVVRQYSIAHGKGRRGDKQRRGDNRTPVGVYSVMELKTSDRFHYFMQLNYPTPKDAWRGYRAGLISAREFRAVARAHKSAVPPPQTTALGGHIGIHGLGTSSERKMRIHETENWTEGCIALTNDELDELRRYITPGVKVHIRE